MRIKYLLMAVGCLIIIGCATRPNAENYSKVMNEPVVKNGDVANKEMLQLNQTAWNKLKIASATSVRRLDDDSYANNPSDGLLYVRATIVNEGDSPVQAKWRCKFYDSNNMVLNDDDNDEPATTTVGMGWHTMIAYPLRSKSHTDEANVVRCIAPKPTATNFKIEVHDTANDVTVYN